MISALVILLGSAMIIAAVLSLHAKSLLAAVIGVGLVSLFASVIFLLMAAPDVAMTEAAIGAGISTVIFVYAIRRTRNRDVEDD